MQQNVKLEKHEICIYSKSTLHSDSVTNIVYMYYFMQQKS